MKDLINLIISNRDILILTSIIIILDNVTGLTKAFKTNNYQSEKFKKSITKFITYGSGILLGGIFDVIFNIQTINVSTKITINGAISTVIIVIIIITESSSIIENLKECGFNVPFLSKIIKEKEDEIENGLQYSLEDVVDDLDEIEDNIIFEDEDYYKNDESESEEY